MLPPVDKAVTGELTRVVTGSEHNIADILNQIIQAVWNNYTIGESWKIVVIDG